MNITRDFVFSKDNPRELNYVELTLKDQDGHEIKSRISGIELRMAKFDILESTEEVMWEKMRKIQHPFISP